MKNALRLATTEDMEIINKFVAIDLDKPVEGYEEYDFHKGTKVRINHYPFQIMAEDGELSFEAEAIVLTDSYRRKYPRPEIGLGELIGIVVIENGASAIYAYRTPERVWQQGFILK